jgi:trk system potassium uptake protein TrkH
MNLAVVQRILGQLLMIFSVTMLPPVAVSLYFQDGNWSPFLDSFLALLAVGALIWWPVRDRHRDLRLRDGFLVVALFWVVLGIAGAAPLVLSDRPDMTLTDAVFEAVSGFTTTGATVLIGLDTLPQSVLYYRQQICWFGGIGMVVLAVALLPMLGVGGMQLLKAETPGPVKNAKLTPRITETAKALWLIYVAVTAACALAFWAAGMSLFDAIGHSFAVLSTAGYSTHDASLAYFNSATIEMIAVFFMFLGGINFSLHFTAWRHKRLGDYWRDPEWRVYAGILATSVILCTVTLWLSGYKSTPVEALRVSLVHAVSVQTSTGFTTENFALWPGALPLILVLTMFIGGCAGSTGGGMKVVRWLMIWKQGSREVFKLIHPSAEMPVKLGNKALDWRVIDGIWGFFAVYVVSFGVLMVLLMATGEDQVTAFSAIATSMNNVGPGLGDVASNFTSISMPGKWICILAMLLGRLEVFPLLVLITPAFWRR